MIGRLPPPVTTPHLASAEPIRKARHLPPQDRVRLGQLRIALRERVLDERPQIVDRVQLDPGQSAHGRINVARHGEIDQQQRCGILVTTARDRALDLIAVHDQMGRACGADDHVGLRQGFVELARGDDPAAMPPREPFRARDVAAEYEQLPSSGLDERLGRQLGPAPMRSAVGLPQRPEALAY